MVYISLDGHKKHFDSVKDARAKGLKMMYQFGMRSMGIYNDNGSMNGEIAYDYNYESGYAYTGYDKDGKPFHKALRKDGSVGPNKYAKKKKK